MMDEKLSVVYLDNQPIGLMEDPRPIVAKVVVASGKVPEDVRVLRGASPGDMEGTYVRSDDVIDRTTDPETPIYLISVPRELPWPPRGLLAVPSFASNRPAPPREETGRRNLLASDPDK